jgi:rhodanese-related sulfurtransferase
MLSPVAATPVPLDSDPVVDRILAEARSRIAPRVAPSDLDAARAGGALVVDTRSAAQRDRDGVLPGAVIVERNVLEWRLDPTSPHRLEQMDRPDRRVIIVCDEGYGSSLAAASLADLGLTDVTDLEGGYRAWLRVQDADGPALD